MMLSSKKTDAVLSTVALLAMQVGGLKDWHSALTTTFVAAAVLLVVNNLRALLADPPTKSDDMKVAPRT